ncbi:MAG: peptidylprolyl isomerase [Clostridia bacterium]|nr:peptidylprolyl isomerase [Clostridia bacterium]
MDKFKKILLIVIVLILVGILGVLSFSYLNTSVINKKKNPVVTMEIEGYGTIEMELYPDIAPNTVNNFIALAESGFYDGKTFSEIGDSYIEGGYDLTEVPEEDTSAEVDATVESTDGETKEEKYIVGPKLSDIKELGEDEEDSSYAIKGEFIDSGNDKNRLNHSRGIVSMARVDVNDYQAEILTMRKMAQQDSSYDYESIINMLIDNMNDSATSGFFIMTDSDTSYNGTYTAFGKVINGMDVVDKISETETKKDENGKEVPVTQPVIKSIKVDKKGVEYDKPDTINVFDFDSIFKMFLSNN